eukprot:2035004-Prymnesium_polylepis.1
MNFGVEARDGEQRFDRTRPRARGRCARTRASLGRLPRRALRLGQHAGPHAAQPVGWARAGCRGPPAYPRPARAHA